MTNSTIGFKPEPVETSLGTFYGQIGTSLTGACFLGYVYIIIRCFCCKAGKENAAFWALHPMLVGDFIYTAANLPVYAILATRELTRMFGNEAPFEIFPLCMAGSVVGTFGMVISLFGLCYFSLLILWTTKLTVSSIRKLQPSWKFYSFCFILTAGVVAPEHHNIGSYRNLFCFYEVITLYGAGNAAVIPFALLFSVFILVLVSCNEPHESQNVGIEPSEQVRKTYETKQKIAFLRMSAPICRILVVLYTLFLTPVFATMVTNIIELEMPAEFDMASGICIILKAFAVICTAIWVLKDRRHLSDGLVRRENSEIESEVNSIEVESPFPTFAALEEEGRRNPDDDEPLFTSESRLKRKKRNDSLVHFREKIREYSKSIDGSNEARGNSSRPEAFFLDFDLTSRLEDNNRKRSSSTESDASMEI